MQQFFSLLTTLGLFVLLIGLLVLVHEFGHYIVARLIDAKVEEFALGLGPVIYKKRIGETDYMIKLFPIGGYVKILGEIEEKKSDNPRSLQNKKPFLRILVMIAGIVMNLILASVLYYFVLANNEYKVYLSNSFENYTPVGGVINQEKIGNGYVEYTSLIDGGGAKNSGMNEKGYLKKINDEDINFSNQIPEIISENIGKEISVIACEKEDCSDEKAYSVKVNDDGKIGISIQPNYVTVLSYQDNKLLSGIVHGINIFRLSLQGMSQIFSQAKVTGDYSMAVNTVSGPVGIFLAIDKIKQYGIIAVVSLCADLSLVLGIMNLLPIPALDGGRIILTLPELFTGRKINPKFEAVVINISFIILLILMFVVFVKDIVFFKYIKDLLG